MDHRNLLQNIYLYIKLSASPYISSRFLWIDMKCGTSQIRVAFTLGGGGARL